MPSPPAAESLSLSTEQEFEDLGLVDHGLDSQPALGVLGLARVRPARSHGGR